MKKWMLMGWLMLIFSTMVALFYQNEWKYSLPTPVPANYQAPPTKTCINSFNKLFTENNKPVFIHFFNPDCPCSKFNMPHFASLVKKYGDKINFVMVVFNNKHDYTAEEIQDKYTIPIPVIFDKALADSCGVYSTPQAVLLDKNHKLYYRGNYNKSRYCTNKNSNYAQIAIDAILSNTDQPAFNQLALKAYGCELPNCNK